MDLMGIIGIIMIAMALTGFVLSQSPLVTSLFGGTIGENIRWAGSFSAVLIGAGVVLMTLNTLKVLALPLGLVAFVMVYVLMNWGAWFG